jgi:hypothetical protein
MRLVRFKPAEIAETTASATASTAAAEATASPTAKTATSAPKTTSAPRATACASTGTTPRSILSAASLATTAGKRLIQFGVVAKLLHVYPGEGVG